MKTFQYKGLVIAQLETFVFIDISEDWTVVKLSTTNNVTSVSLRGEELNRCIFVLDELFSFIDQFSEQIGGKEITFEQSTHTCGVHDYNYYSKVKLRKLETWEKYPTGEHDDDCVSEDDT